MVQILDKYGNTSTDDARVLVLDKYGNIKKVSGGGGSPTGPAGGDLSGTYPNPSVVWANGETVYNSVYYPLSSNPAGYLTSASLTGYVPTSRTITINGTTYDLTSNRTWSVGDLLSSGSYANPSWITSLAYSKLTGAPTIPTVNPSALTKTDDTNVTLTLGGTPSTALLQAVSLTLGWTGTLADSRIASAATWNAKQNAITLTTTGTGAATFISNTLNIPTPPAATFTSLTTTGSSGSSTLLSGVLNVPTYTLSGLGGQPLSTNLTSLSGLTYASASFVKMTAAGTFALDTNTYLTTAVTSVSGTGTVAGLSLSGTVTSTGNITLGGTLSTPVSTINDSTTVGQNFVKLTNPSAITFPRINADNTVSTLDAATFRTAIGAGTSSTNGTVTSVAALTLGTTGTDLSSSVANGTTTPVITLNVPTASATNRGALSSADWNTFNNKQNALGYTPYRYVNTTQTTATGSTSKTVLATAAIPAGTFSASDVMKLGFRITRATASAAVTLRMEISLTSSIADAFVVGTYGLALSNIYAFMQRTFTFSSNNIYGFGFTTPTNIISDVAITTSSSSNTGFNCTNAFWVFFTIQQGAAGDSTTLGLANITN